MSTLARIQSHAPYRYAWFVGTAIALGFAVAMIQPTASAAATVADAPAAVPALDARTSPQDDEDDEDDEQVRSEERERPKSEKKERREAQRRDSEAESEVTAAVVVPPVPPSPLVAPKIAPKEATPAAPSPARRPASGTSAPKKALQPVQHRSPQLAPAASDLEPADVPAATAAPVLTASSRPVPAPAARAQRDAALELWRLRFRRDVANRWSLSPLGARPSIRISQRPVVAVQPDQETSGTGVLVPALLALLLLLVGGAAAPGLLAYCRRIELDAVLRRSAVLALLLGFLLAYVAIV